MKTLRWIAAPVFLLLAAVTSSCGRIDDGIAECYHPDWKCNCACIEIYQPVCGCNDVTYSNDCFARIDGYEVAYQGKCK